ncbi:hypothetical protein I7I53_02951 [Histoplasma capsulatum var. duboisii H88]|uniref:Uncharacterized protein n=1 Tax=Ajellomyces capsulatus (strain H88) TaxID=544711 RepID=A0A8A1LLE2_AJEC8|nr:hypothetical protein I7I53_02951 [Histoplasma capsulatum var. duboisii H88]
MALSIPRTKVERTDLIYKNNQVSNHEYSSNLFRMLKCFIHKAKHGIPGWAEACQTRYHRHPLNFE